MSAGSIASSLVLVLLAGLAIAGASYEVLAHDVSYYLYVSREILAGALPFRDYIDPNLPTIIYLGVPLAVVSSWTGIPIWTWFQGFVVLIEAISVGLSAWLLRTRVLADDDELFWIVLAASVTALCLVPMGLVNVDSSHFGQREHLALLFVTPYALWHAARASGESRRSLSGRAAFAIAAFATIGIAIKPHFLLFWALLEGWSAWRERGRWPRVALLPPVAFGLYFALLLLTLPEFPTMISYTWQLYGAYKDRTPLEVLRLAPVALPLAILLLHRLVPVSEPLRPLRSALGVATLAWWIIGFMQLRGFPYHFAPAVSLSLMLAVLSLVGTKPGRIAIPIVYALLVYLAFASVEIAWRDRYGQDVHLTKLFQERAPGGAVLVLSSNVWPSFPAALYANTRWSSRFPALWFLPGLYEDVPAASPFAYRKPEEMGTIERWHLDAVIEDFERQPPQVVLLDRNRFQPGFGETNFDYLAYLKQDPRFREIWCAYQERDRWQETFTVYERTPNPTPPCRGRA